MSNEKSNTPAKKLPPIKMRYVKRENVSVDDCIGMYKLFSVYYQNTPFETFMADLSKKTGVHIAKRVTDGKVCYLAVILLWQKNIGVILRSLSLSSVGYWLSV